MHRIEAGCRSALAPCEISYLQQLLASHCYEMLYFIVVGGVSILIDTPGVHVITTIYGGSEVNFAKEVGGELTRSPFRPLIT